MFNKLKASAGRLGSAVSRKACGVQGRVAGAVIAGAASTSAMADGTTYTPTAKVQQITGQVSADANFLVDWGYEIFTTLLVAGLIWKLSGKLSKKATNG